MRMARHRQASLIAGLAAALMLSGCTSGSGPVEGTAQAKPGPVLLPAGSAPAAVPAEILPGPADLGETWRLAEQAPPAALDGCSRAGSALAIPESAVRRVLTDGTVFAEVAAWSSTDADAASATTAVRGGAFEPPQPPCELTPRVVEIPMGPTVEPGSTLDDDRAADALVRVEHVSAGGQVAATEFLVAVQRGPVVVVTHLYGGAPHGQHTAAFAAHQASVAAACAEAARPGCEGPATVGAGLLAPAVLGPGWTAGMAVVPPRRSSLFCNGVGGYGYSGTSINSARRQFSGPGDASAFQGILSNVDPATSAELRMAAADKGAHTSMACAEVPERTEEMLVDEVDEQAGTWDRLFRVTETLASGESATALLVGVGRGAVVGLLTVRDDGAPVDGTAMLEAVRTGVCAVPTSTGC
jgi:hypothetical protein